MSFSQAQLKKIIKEEIAKAIKEEQINEGGIFSSLFGNKENKIYEKIQSFAQQNGCKMTGRGYFSKQNGPKTINFQLSKNENGFNIRVWDEKSTECQDCGDKFRQQQISINEVDKNLNQAFLIFKQLIGTQQGTTQQQKPTTDDYFSDKEIPGYAPSQQRIRDYYNQTRAGQAVSRKGPEGIEPRPYGIKL